MMRVEINIDEAFRGLVKQYSKEHNITMPSAYAELLHKGIYVSDIDLDDIDLGIDEDEVSIR